MMHMQHASIGLSVEMPQHSCNMLPQQQQLQQHQQHRQRLFGSAVSSSKFPFKCRSLSLALPSIMRHVALASSRPVVRPSLILSVAQSCSAVPVQSSAASPLLWRSISVPRVASGSCLPKKAHTPSWEAPAAAAPHVGVQSVCSLQTSMLFRIPCEWVAGEGV